MGGFWDELFSREDYAYGTAPNEFLASNLPRLKPGMKALSVADGEGRNGVWLARQGLDVLSVDSSAVGLEKARKLAESYSVPLKTVHADLLSWDWPTSEFDLIVSIFIHFAPDQRRRMHSAMQAALRPGGWLILIAFTPEQLMYGTGGPPQPELLYTADFLRRDFKELEISVLEEAVVNLLEGSCHFGPASLVRIVARKI